MRSAALRSEAAAPARRPHLVRVARGSGEEVGDAHAHDSRSGRYARGGHADACSAVLVSRAAAAASCRRPRRRAVGDAAGCRGRDDHLDGAVGPRQFRSERFVLAALWLPNASQEDRAGSRPPGRRADVAIGQGEGRSATRVVQTPDEPEPALGVLGRLLPGTSRPLSPKADGERPPARAGARGGGIAAVRVEAAVGKRVDAAWDLGGGSDERRQKSVCMSRRMPADQTGGKDGVHEKAAMRKCSSPKRFDILFSSTQQSFAD